MSAAAAIAGAAALQVNINSQMQAQPNRAMQTIHVSPGLTWALVWICLGLLLLVRDRLRRR